MMLKSLMLTPLCAATLAVPSLAGTAKVEMSVATVGGGGAGVGTLVLSDTAGGLRVAFDLHGLPAGPHGLHVHAKNSCAPGPNKDGKIVAAGAAGGHFDPTGMDKHLGPTGNGHQGDLPFITVDAAGTAKGEIVAPHLVSVTAVQGHALVLHAGGDNYADEPAPLGGGGARIACGTVE
jgi:Cu-Zn family superoxide dismutase